MRERVLALETAARPRVLEEGKSPRTRSKPKKADVGAVLERALVVLDIRKSRMAKWGFCAT